jgi:hypothetical protein
VTESHCEAMLENWIFSLPFASETATVRVIGAKPGSSAVRRYSPGSTFKKEN